MKDLTPVLFILLGCALAVPRAGAEAHVRPQQQEQARRLEQMIRSAMKKNRIVGLSATVLSEGESLLCEGWGHADGERRKPVTAESLFPIGSVTKLFTATAVMQLVERGKVNLDAPLSRYLPELAGSALDAHAPTVRQVLTHHAGIPGNYMEGFELEKPAPEAFRQLPRLAAGLPPAFAPDTVFAYSNEGYALLGSLVERVCGMPFGEAVTRGILEPLGMSRARFFLAEEDRTQSVMGFDGRKQRAIYPIRDLPAGALMASAADMERFMRFMFDGGGHGVLGEAAFAEMTRRQNAGVALDGEFSIGLGYWLIRPFASEQRFVSHGGDIPPFHALLVTVPDRRTGVFLAANSSGAASALIPLAVTMIRSLLEWQTGEPIPEPAHPARVRPDSAVLRAAPGLYASPLGLIEVRSRGERIFARLQGLPVELIARADGTFTLEASVLGLFSVPLRQLAPVRLSFFAHAGSTYLRITALGVLAGVGERFTPQEASASWKARAGRYRRICKDPNASCQWPANVSLRADRGRGLLLRFDFPGLGGAFPLEARDGARAVVRGKGTGLGDTLTAREDSGKVYLEWSGMLFEKM